MTEREAVGCWMDPNGELRAEEILKEFALSEENTVPLQRVTLFPLGSVSTVSLESEKELRLWAIGEEVSGMEKADE